MIAAVPLLMLLSPSLVGTVSSEDLDAYLEQVLTVRKACGPTSAWYCLRRLGHPVKLRTIWGEAPIDVEGVRIGDVLDLLQAHGASGRAIRGDPARLDALPSPAILIIDDKHCVVYEGLDPQTRQVRYFEPALGRMRTVPREEMQRHWSGEAIVFESPALSPRAFASVVFLGFAGVLASVAVVRWCVSRLRSPTSHYIAGSLGHSTAQG